MENSALRVVAIIRWLWGDEMDRPDQRYEEDNEPPQEKHARSAARRIDLRWQIHDHMPLFIFAGLFVSHFYEIFGIKQRPFIILYLGTVTFILIGALFAKRYIEQTIHYQRVRELVYVLETAHVAKVIGKKKLPDPLEIERFSYDIGLALKEPAPPKTGSAQDESAAI